MAEIIPFYTSRSVFSNFYGCRFKVNGLLFNCNEQFYQYSKAIHFGDEHTAQLILNAVFPKEHKFLAKKIKGFDRKAWNLVSEGVMYQRLKEKFSQNIRFKKQLLATGTACLVEASPNDTYWGAGKSISEIHHSRT